MLPILINYKLMSFCESDYEPSKFGPGKNSKIINPKMGSNSEIMFNSELSAIDSGRP
jgi:hypothetical protein